jgi:hypothetical protein
MLPSSMISAAFYLANSVSVIWRIGRVSKIALGVALEELTLLLEK